MTVWTREDDVRGGYYRPYGHERLTAALGEDGLPVAMTYTSVVQSLLKGTLFEAMLVDKKTGLDGTTHEGAIEGYAIPNVRVDVHQSEQPVPVLWWRSVGHTHSGFAMESFIDECAHATGRDPVEYRLALLQDKPRHLAALRLAAEKAGWGTPLPPGRARGVAVHESFGSVVAEVAEVSLQDGRPRVLRVVAAIHCGTAVNPALIAHQLESAVTYGLSAALDEEITIEDGRVRESNFNDYPMMRMREMPLVEAHVVPSDAPPTGVGEPGTPPIAPAVANALFALTGVRARKLPLKHTDFTKKA
jgi:isoquinoline 1-oxidoreductase beta subunit